MSSSGGSAPPVQPRILLVTGGLDCGGAQRVMAGMANYWAAKGWRIELATWTGPEIADFYELAANVSRIWLGVPLAHPGPLGALRASVLRVLKLRRLLKESRPEAVISFIDVSNIYTIMASIGLGVRVVVSERTNPSVNQTVSRPWRVLRRICYSWATQVVAQTPEAAKWIERQCHARVAVIPNPLRELPALACERQPFVIAVGRLTKEKGIDLLLQAFTRINAQFPEWRLYVLGEGPERRALESLRDELGLADSTEFLGQVRDVETWMARCGLMAHPSRREGFPNTVLEAMGMGAAVICANCPSGPAELIRDGVDGRLVPVGDVAELARVMAELMSRPALRVQLGREATRVRQRYEPGAIMMKWEECLGLQPVP
jgi:GalNAc-alpha-(1->4)-GalNAc-alpha-(1->3)-diNAcBac-PP-undecaprenol alpha-1,4-N-acetyl-D-galactosaminyltransferase